MKNRLYKIPVYGLLALMTLLIFHSCYDNTLDNKSPVIPVGVDKVRFQLNINSGNYISPSPRATASEDEIGDNIWVLVFSGNDLNNAVFKEVAKADITSEGIFVLLTKSTDKSFITVIANAPDKFYNPVANAVQNLNEDNIKLALTGEKLEDAEGILLTEALAQPVFTSVPYLGNRVPMSGIAELTAGVSSDSSISNSGDGKLYLSRIVAKTDVTSVAPDFLLLGATVVNTPVSGSFIHLNGINSGTLTNYLATGSADNVCDIAGAVWNSTISGYTTSASPVYTYESKKGNNTSVIIKAEYNKTAYYYKLAYVDASGNLMDIERNKHYKFEITSVTGTGHSSSTAAMDANPSNINYTITVTDSHSHDIISNGKYYLGVSNSELVVYGDGNQSNIIAFTVTTDASSADVNINSVSVQGTGLTLQSPVANGPIELLQAPSTPGSTEIKVSLSSTFTSGSVTVKLGDLAKTVSIIRRSALAYTGLEPIDGEFVYGVITNQGINDWLCLSTDGATACADEINISSPGTVYIMASSNISTTGASNREGGEFYLSRNNEEGRVKFLVTQGCLNLGDLQIDPFGYVGAFWKKDQTGERLIRIPHETGTEGAWTAFVLEGEDFIKLDLEDSKDPNIGWKAGANESNVADMNEAANDATYQVGGNLNSVSGVLQSDGYIYFRIGLKSTYTSTTDNPVRYGVVLLSYNENSKFSKIYIRQGEDADYLMRKNDRSDLMNVNQRDNVKKIAAYNIVSKDQYDEEKIGGSLQQNHAHIDTRNGEFAQYPTHVGGFLQYANEFKMRISYHPFNPVGALSSSIWNTTPKTGAWDDDLIYTYETCPRGWRRPYDGSSKANESGQSNANSEFRQSLYLHPVSGGTTNNFNSIYGYYADGFFDRRKIVDSPSGTPLTAVSIETNSIAYAGYLFYNPYNNASVFFPLSGRRAATDGSLELSGKYAAYWSGTQYNDASAWVLQLETQTPRQFYISKNSAVSIRCVVE